MPARRQPTFLCLMATFATRDVAARPCSRQCVRDCGLNETAGNPILSLPFRLYHSRSERPGTRQNAHYSNTYLELVHTRHTRERQWERPDGSATTPPTHAIALQELHEGSDIYEGLEATGAALKLEAQPAVSPSAALKFMRNLIRARKPRFVVEVGVFMGYTSIAMAKALDEVHAKDAGPFVLSIDSWLGDAYMWVIRKKSRCGACKGSYADILQSRHGKPAFYYNFLSNVVEAKVRHRIVPLPLATNEAARVIDYLGWRPELVYIDASHDSIDVLHDLEHFYYLLACGGVLVGDDYHWPAVRLAVDWFANGRRLRLRISEIFGGGTSSERAVPVARGGAFQGEINKGPGASGRTINSKWLVEKECLHPAHQPQA